VLAISLMSFIVVNDCSNYANDAVQDEIDYYGKFKSSEDRSEAYEWYYRACIESGGPGNIAPPVLLKVQESSGN